MAARRPAHMMVLWGVPPSFTSILTVIFPPHRAATMIATIPQTAEAARLAKIARGNRANLGSWTPRWCP